MQKKRILYNILLATLLVTIFAALPASANPQPGGSCAGYPEGAIAHSGGPELGGVYYVMRCTSNVWEETAPNPDTTPDPFSFTDQPSVATSTLILSDIVTITGITAAAAVDITGDGSPAFRVGGGAWLTSGTISDGETLQLRLTSNAAHSTINSATVTVGTGSDQWDVTTEPSDPCAGSPSPGQACSDGSIYAGLSPDGNVAMYATPADAPGTYEWGPETTTTIAPCTDGTPGTASSCRTGQSNTNVLAGLAGNFDAADYCDGLSAHGHNDWYLPAQDELDVLYNNRGAIGGFGTDWYWSSSEIGEDAKAQRFSNGDQDGDHKDERLHVRCVRR